MAGCPQRREQKALLSWLTAYELDDIFDRIASAEPLTQVAEAYKVSRRALVEWMDDDPDRLTRYNRARLQSAGMRVERADRHAAEATPETVGVAKLRIQQEQWMASRLDRESYGEQKGPAVQINLATLHIDALRRQGANTSATDSQSDARRGQVVENKGQVKVIERDCAND